MNNKIINSLFCVGGVGIGSFVSRKNCFEQFLPKVMDSKGFSLNEPRNFSINIPFYFWVGMLIPIWGISVWIICEKIYFRKADIVTRCVDSVLNLIKDKNISNWFKNQFQKENNIKTNETNQFNRKSNKKQQKTYFEDSE